jgi:hypothetical protein
MRFASQGVCIMHYCGLMRYAMQFLAHQLGGHMERCVIRGYTLSEVCIIRGSTVQARASNTVASVSQRVRAEVGCGDCGSYSSHSSRLQSVITLCARTCLLPTQLRLLDPDHPLMVTLEVGSQKSHRVLSELDRRQL